MRSQNVIRFPIQANRLVGVQLIMLGTFSNNISEIEEIPNFYEIA